MTPETDPRRQAVRRAWRDTLERDPVSDDENFFDAGGNSILVVQLQRRLSDAFGYRVPLRQIHSHPTVGGLVGLDMPHQAAQAGMAAVSAPGLDLYCVPYAGSSARIYDGWEAKIPSTVAVRPLEFPGRGSRWSEGPRSELSTLVEDLAESMVDARRRPYAVFGHSFGGIVAFELVRYLLAQGFPNPRHLLVSGCAAPQAATPVETTHDVSEEELTRRLRSLQGTPEELLQNDELMELYIPIIRADYTIVDNYRAPPPGPLGCPITAFFGRGDREAVRSVMDGWRAYGTDVVTVEEVDGDHFFLHKAEDELVQKVATALGA